jgi:hypothetical protein
MEDIIVHLREEKVGIQKRSILCGQFVMWGQHSTDGLETWLLIENTEGLYCIIGRKTDRKVNKKCSSVFLRNQTNYTFFPLIAY